jgi:hypothetical protein
MGSSEPRPMGRSNRFKVGEQVLKLGEV